MLVGGASESRDFRPRFMCDWYQTRIIRCRRRRPSHSAANAIGVAVVLAGMSYVMVSVGREPMSGFSRELRHCK